MKDVQSQLDKRDTVYCHEFDSHFRIWDRFLEDELKAKRLVLIDSVSGNTVQKVYRKWGELACQQGYWNRTREGKRILFEVYQDCGF